ncbi:pentapeptide repeat-containing protein [Actinosynnema sp. CS-041913]|uniref:pentapeptide repeat-containing protein n=1 Tax=Actinosynnema sp. CS-041913 TaxID=3239917 RepID=UPI003D8A1076
MHREVVKIWLIALLGAAVLEAEDLIRIFRNAGGQFVEAKWIWPLAAALGVTVLVNPHVRRLWPRLTSRIMLALFVSVALSGLVAIVGPLRVMQFLILAGIGALMAAWVLVLPRRLAPPLSVESLKALEGRDRIELVDARLKRQNEVRTTALQAVAGTAVLVGAVLAFQQFTEDRQQATTSQELTRQGLASERFTRAIDQLGSDRLEVQIGGIYGLEQIAQQAPDNRLTVTEVLVAYIQRRSQRSNEPTTGPPRALHARAPEVHAALSVLMRRNATVDDPELDLSGLDLSGAEVKDQSQASSEGDRVYKAADLQRVNLRGADLRGASFFMALMSGADLRDTDLRGARLKEVHLVGVDFRGADLRGADLVSDYSGFFLGLTGRPEKFKDSGIKTARFSGARADESTKWPEGFDWRAAGVKMT